MEAKAKLFRRFLDSYGPSTMRDFRHWWGGARVGIDGLETLSGDLEVVESDGFKGLMSRQSAEEARGLDPARAVNLLPSFDCYAMFYSPRDAFVPGTHRARIFRQTAGWNYPAVVIDGAAAGIWSLRRGRRQIEITVEGFRAFQTREKKGIENEAEDIGRYYEAPAELIYRAVGQ